MKLQLLAFVRSPRFHQHILSLTESLKLSATRIIAGDIDSAVPHLADNESPQLLLVEMPEGTDKQQSLSTLADVCEPGTQVILCGRDIELNEYRTLLAQGILDYVPESSDEQTLIRAAREGLGFGHHDKTGSHQHIVVCGLQGGVGSTMLTAALGHILSTQGTHTLLADIACEYGDLSTYWQNINPVPLKAGQIIEMPSLSRAVHELSPRLNYLPVITGTNEESITGLCHHLAQETSRVIWDLPRHQIAAPVIMSQADICVWVLESSAGVVRHWHAIRNRIDFAPHCRHILVLNQTRKERQRQIPQPQLEQALQQNLHTLPYSVNAVSAANLGEVSLLMNGALGHAIDEIAGRITARLVKSKNNSVLSELLNRITGPKKTKRKQQMTAGNPG